MNKSVLLLVVLLLAGCGGAPTAIRYYVIDPATSGSIYAEPHLNHMSVQVVDIKLPQYLERFQIAKREGRNRLVFSNNHQWGESLRKNLYRTMAGNLSVLLSTDDIGTAISRSFATPDYTVRLSIESFEQGADGRVRLLARYQVGDKSGDIITRTFEATGEASNGSRYDDMVSDMQVLFAALCRSIAYAVSELERTVR